MRSKIVKIGNSKGIRLPKTIIEQCELKDEVTLQVKDKKIIISSSKVSRKGWAEEFRRLTKNQEGKDDLKEFRNFTTQWENEEWQW